MNLFDATYETAKDQEGHWQFVSRKKTPNLSTAPLEADAVAIVAIHRIEKKLVVLKEFRIPIGDYEWSLPAGLPDKGESFEDTAIRELKEETGLIVTKVIKVSPPVIHSAGLSDESSVIVYVECEGELSSVNLDGIEDIEAHLLDVSQLRELMNDDNKKKSRPCWLVANMFDMLGRIAFLRETS